MLDIKDKKILSELLQNAKISHSQLAKKVGVSREMIAYRMKRLEEKHIIKQYYTLINHEALELRRHIVFLQINNVSIDKEKEILEYLKQHRYVTSLSPIIGKWNFVFDLIIPDDNALKETIQEIGVVTEQYKGSFIVISGYKRGVFYPTKLVGIQKDITFKQTNKYVIDEKDKRILRLIAEHARIEYIELSQKLDMPATTIAHRIKNLERSGIIQGYTCAVDYKLLGWECYNLQIQLTQTHNETFYQFAKSHMNIQFYYEYFGHEGWDVDLGIIVRDINELRKIIVEIKEHCGNALRIQNMYAVERSVKDNITPKGALD